MCVSHDLDSGGGVSRGEADSPETCFVADNEVSWRLAGICLSRVFKVEVSRRARGSEQ